jgi:predicted nucleic acid-binding protein
MAANDVFMDTAGFLALWDAADAHHQRALRLQSELARKGRRFLTTDYILDETVTLLLVRHSHAAAAFFARHDDKKWSFTDCMSFSLMHDLNVRDSFTTDQHFRQAGFNPLLGKPI